MKRQHIMTILAALGLLASGCRPESIIPEPGPEVPADTTGTGRAEPADTVGTDPVTPDRWADTGADVPDYPSYNAVSKLADFPRVDIVTDDGARISDKYNYKSGKITFRDPTGMYSDSVLLGALPMQVRGRGNTSWNAEGGRKNSYRVKLDTKHKVFGMNGDRDWLLISEVKDASLLRNAVSQRIARLVSMPWAPRFRAVELYINGKYAGCYTLFEHKETGGSKVRVTPMQPGESEGGFFIEMDNKEDRDNYFWSESFGKKFKYKDPDGPTDAQQAFIKDQVNTLESLLEKQKFDKETGYWAHAEVVTFVRNFIVQELSKNPDGNMRLSTYFAKDSDTKLFMPMCWDFDLALGNTHAMWAEFEVDTAEPEGWYVKIRGDYPYWNNYGYHNQKDTYYQYMFRDPQFVELLKQEWNAAKPRLDKIPAYIDKMYEYNTLAYTHNDNSGFAPYVSSWGGDDWNIIHSSTHAEAVKYLKEFYTERLAWMDKAINSL